jgi:hypothetical protein
MSVMTKDTIDGMGMTKDETGLVLLIGDHLGWEDEQTHLRLLRDKISSYMSFLQSGGYKRICSVKSIRSYIIEVHFSNEVPRSADLQLQDVQDACAREDISLRYCISQKADRRILC